MIRVAISPLVYQQQRGEEHDLSRVHPRLLYQVRGFHRARQSIRVLVVLLVHRTCWPWRINDQQRSQRSLLLGNPAAIDSCRNPPPP